MPILVEIKQRSNRANWYFYWVDGTGNSRYLSTRFPVAEYPELRELKKIKDLERSRTELQMRLNEGYDPRKRPVGTVPFKEVLDCYLEDPVLKMRSKPSFERNIKQKIELLRSVFGDKLVGEITTSVLADWFNSRNKYAEDRSGRRVIVNGWNQLDYKGHIDRIFKFAIKKGFADKNPIRAILDQNPNFFPKPPEPKAITLSEEEFEAILEALGEIEKRYKRFPTVRFRVPAELFRDVFLFRLHQGTRVQEALDIQIRDISRREVPTKQGTEGRLFVFIKPGKTGHGRTIPILKTVEEIVLRNAAKKGSDDFLFSVMGRRLKTCNMRSIFGKTIALASVKLPGLKQKKLRFYDTRHLCLTRLALQGVGDRLLGSFAGHRSRKSTDVYVQFSDEQLVEVARTAEGMTIGDCAKSVPPA